MTGIVTEVKYVLDVLSSISSYFHKSGMRTAELQTVAKENNLKLCSIPKIFMIRWTEWTHSTVVAVLKSWNALVIYFVKNEKDPSAAGHANFLKNFCYRQLIAFVADVLHIYHRFHKKVQSESLTIVNLAKYIDLLTSALNGLRDNNLVGGWAEQLKQNIINDENDGGTFLKGIEIVTENSTRSHHKRDFSEIRCAILNTLIAFKNVSSLTKI